MFSSTVHGATTPEGQLGFNLGYWPEKIGTLAVFGGIGFLVGGPTGFGVSSAIGKYLIESRWQKAGLDATQALAKVEEKKKNAIISCIAFATIASISLSVWISATANRENACQSNPASSACGLTTWMGRISVFSFATSIAGMIYSRVK